MTSSIGGGVSTGLVVKTEVEAAKSNANLGQLQGNFDKTGAAAEGMLGPLNNVASMLELIAAKSLAATVQSRQGTKIAGGVFPGGLALHRQQRDNEANERAAHERDMIALRQDMETRVARRAAEERSAIRDNEHNDTMRFRDAVRARYRAQDEADAAARAQNMTGLMGGAVAPGRSGMISGMSMASAQQDAAAQAADQAERTRRARIHDLRNQMREQEIASERAAIARTEAAQLAADQAERTRRAQIMDFKQRMRDVDAAADRAAIARTEAAQLAADQAERTRRAQIMDFKQKAREADAAAERAAIARTEAAQQAADQAERTRRAKVHDMKQRMRDADAAADRAAMARNAAASRGGAAGAMMTGIMGPMPAAMNQAQQAIARMRADLQPMVGFEMRLAEEAREFRNWVHQAVADNRMNLAEAQLLTREYQEQANLLRQRAAAEHQGFLGMRRMGFAAQQLGYAVEDAATQFGTMGLAGAFRAGSNNLTAMASVMGPMVGVAASLTAAAVSLGIQWWQSKKAIDENTEAAKKLKAVTDNMSNALEFQISLQRQLTDARKADFGQLEQMHEQIKQQIREQEDALQKRLAMEANAAQVKALEDRLAADTLKANAALARGMRADTTPQEREAIAAAIAQQRQTQQELNALKGQQADEAARAVSEEEKLLKLNQQRLDVENLRNKAMRNEAADKMVGEGIEADRSALSMITQRFESLNPELKIQNDILDSRIKLNEQINIGLRAGQINIDQAEKYRKALDEVIRMEAEKRAGEKNLEQLATKEKELLDLANRAGVPAGIAGAVKKGSDEANRLIESEKLRLDAAKEQEPVVNQLRLIRTAIENQKSALEAIAANVPQVATVP